MHLLLWRTVDFIASALMRDWSGIFFLRASARE